MKVAIVDVMSGRWLITSKDGNDANIAATAAVLNTMEEYDPNHPEWPEGIEGSTIPSGISVQALEEPCK